MALSTLLRTLSVSLLVAIAAVGCAGASPEDDETGSSEDEIDNGSTCTPKGVQVRLKVMTMNLRHDANDWEKRFPLIADEIARLQPDIIGLQEVEIADDQADKLNDLIAARLPGKRSPYAHRYQHRKSGIIGWFGGEGIAIFSKFPIVEKKSNDLGERRVALYTRVRLPSGAEVDVYNTHLHAGGAEEGAEIRTKQAKEVVTWAKDNDDCNVTLLTGDMNAKDSSEAYKAFTAGSFVDSYRFVYPDKAKNPGNTSPIRLEGDVRNQDPKNRIDFVFAKRPRGLRAKPVESVVCFQNHNAQFLYPSDHLGVMTTYDLSL